MKILSGVSQCYMNDGEPVKCCHCGGENFQGEVSEIVSGNVAEEYTRCCGCGKILSFWAYGSYEPQPHLIYHPNRIVKRVLNWFIIKGFTK
ncbi:hypothetical protein HNDCFFNB_00080 [Citrobacter phage BSwM KMM2]|nr:hypothetical protein HNDCFFNB_00080 [Citrobacter phage BSwM KMM2]